VLGTEEGKALIDHLKDMGAIELQILELVRVNDYPFLDTAQSSRILSGIEPYSL